jgi:hypothetical protein
MVLRDVVRVAARAWACHSTALMTGYVRRVCTGAFESLCLSGRAVLNRGLCLRAKQPARSVLLAIEIAPHAQVGPCPLVKPVDRCDSGCVQLSPLVQGTVPISPRYPEDGSDFRLNLVGGLDDRVTAK